MSLTNTNREAGRQMRHGGLRDLRFAGTVAAGLVAGVLGVGALSAPLLGWTSRADNLQPGGNEQVHMPAPAVRQAVAQSRPPTNRPAPASGPAAVPGVGSATVLVS